MEFARLPRFKRTAEIAPIQLTRRDREIIRLIHRHRFLRSSHIVALMGDSAQQLLRRLQLLYHHGYLERPRAQIDYYHRGGSRHIVYGLGSKGAPLLKHESGVVLQVFNWSQKNRSIARLFLEHALLVSDVMVAIELACRRSGGIRMLTGDQLLLDATNDHGKTFQWSVNIASRLKLGLIPDGVFALESEHAPGNPAYFFLEADRGTMPVMRESLAQSSFYRKLLAYEATWAQNVHHTRFGFHRFRVLTVTTSAQRALHLAATASELEKGHGLFLFADARSLLVQTPLSPVWRTPMSDRLTSLLD
jgi:hypothetical protein